MRVRKNVNFGTVEAYVKKKTCPGHDLRYAIDANKINKELG
jgi:dTDP-D-glucose 4,6-dehydratase